MANTYSNTVLQEARLWLSQNANQKFEERPVFSEITPVFLDGQRWIPDIEALKQATTQATSVMYLKKIANTAITAKSCTITGGTGGSDSASITWGQRGFEATLQRKQFAGNELKAIAALAYVLAEKEKAFWFSATGMESLEIAYLEANRTYVNAISTGIGHNTWMGNPDYYVSVANADRARFYNWARAEMSLNDYSGNIWDITNTLWSADVANYAAQGTANSTNTAYQFDGFNRKYTNLISATGYNDSVHYLVPEGGVAMLTWNDPLNQAGHVAGQKVWSTYQSKFFPGVTFDVFSIDDCADTTNDGGATQDAVIKYQFILNYAFVKQPLSTTNETPIFKYAISTV